MLLSFLAIAIGLTVLVWSAGKFVEGSAATAGYFGMPPLLIGMVVVGFGTSAPEMVVSALSATQGNPGLALGNAYGSNITNIALILGITALISPIAVHSQVMRKELPILAAVTALAAWQVWDGELTFVDAGATAPLSMEEPLSAPQTKAKFTSLSTWQHCGNCQFFISSKTIVMEWERRYLGPQPTKNSMHVAKDLAFPVIGLMVWM